MIDIIHFVPNGLWGRFATNFPIHFCYFPFPKRSKKPRKVLAKRKELEAIQESQSTGAAVTGTDTSPTLPYNPEAALSEYECESQWRLCVTPRPKQDEDDACLHALLRAKTLRLEDANDEAVEVKKENRQETLDQKNDDGKKTMEKKEGEGDGGQSWNLPR